MPLRALPESELAQTTGDEHRGPRTALTARAAFAAETAKAEAAEQRTCILQAPLLTSPRAPELPTAYPPQAGDPVDNDGRPETSVHRRPAKGADFDEIEVLSTESKLDDAP